MVNIEIDEGSGFCFGVTTTIRQDMGQLAQRSARILLHNIQKPGNAVHEIVSFDLTEGESVREL